MMEITPRDQCCGCEACANICPKNCISFKMDAEGFFMPEIDPAKCVNCGLCKKVCPANSSARYNGKSNSVYAAWALDDKIRTSSSSGGLYSVFAQDILDRGGIVNGTVFNGEQILIHDLFETPEGVASCRGSKYVQSRAGMIYRETKKHLDAGRQVLFLSTPCQVDALYRFLGKDYENLTTCDLLCHGTPSPGFFQQILSWIAPDHGELHNITFRNVTGWGKCAIKAQSPSGEINETSIDRIYTKTFLVGLTLRKNCYACPYATERRVADLTIGDFWEIGRYRHFRHDTSKGVSVVLVNSAKGQALLDRVKDRLFLEKRAFSEARRENHQLYRPMSKPSGRETFYQDAAELTPEDLLRKYKLNPTKTGTLFRKLLTFPFRAVRKIFRVTVKALNLMDRP